MLTMTPLAAATDLHLSDAAGRDLGRVAVGRREDGLFVGDFTPGPDYPAVEPVFRFFAEVVGQQSFSFLDQAEAAVARLGVTVRPAGGGRAVPAADVQIYPDGGFSCRVPVTPAGANGTASPAADQTLLPGG
ncbi:MAG: hypothetical protein C0501_08645 [Isosphaera sp.]|nr:hypothetical protein [Isosphaera sp.]